VQVGKGLFIKAEMKSKLTCVASLVCIRTATNSNIEFFCKEKLYEYGNCCSCGMEGSLSSGRNKIFL